MADLNELFRENGLEGVVPYAFDKQGKGYEFLRRKLLEGVRFYIVMSESTGLPFIFAQQEKTYFCLYSNMNAAEFKCDKLAKDKLYTFALDAEPKDSAPDLFLRYRDMGITHLLMDDSIWIDMRDIVTPATYDGLLNVSVPLRNARLNAAMYCMLQYTRADIPCDELIAYFWTVFKNSHFLVPVRPNNSLKPGQKISLDNTSFHVLTDDETEYIAVFTDPDFLALYAEAYELQPEEWTAAVTPGFADLVEYMKGNPKQKIVINPVRGDYGLDLDLFAQLDVIALTHQAINS